MGYYKSKLLASQFIDKEMKEVLNGEEKNVFLLILNATGNYEVPEKEVLKRLDYWKKAFPQIQEDEDGQLSFNKEGV